LIKLSHASRKQTDNKAISAINPIKIFGEIAFRNTFE